MFGRDGSFSMLRVGTIAALVGVVLIVAAVVFFFVDRASHQIPLDIEPYPGAVSGGNIIRSNVSRTVFYQVPNIAPEVVLEHYQKKMNDFYGPNEDKEFRECKRFPPVGEQFEYTRGDAGVVPYQFTCLFDRSGFFVSQYTTVVIQPGIEDNQGITIVAYDQTWQS